ncbi:CRM-domain containing factor CFM2, chloroplastic-like isoform X1 [Vicia villosa]|uniref:CRM-domain containing factor CFM2, chloroplastic-like isoform X1 n=2 Tax=Vicia villosa TaxID=3911 RepID=UPI00273BC117|nr:CRM-domain containing factor CFM2, chloroplastic-like isoform X1 [Vicia villosa]
MLLPATNFHTFTPSSPFFSFPFHFPNSKTLTPTPAKFIVRSSVSKSRTLPKSAIQRIADKLHSLGITTDQSTSTSTSTSTNAGEIFVPLPHNLPKHRVGHTLDLSWSTPENPVPLPGKGIEKLSENEVERQRLEKEKARQEKRRRVPTLAELSLTDGEILRLTKLGFEMKQKIKVGKAGVKEGIVNGIHERWRRSEVVRIICEDLCRTNMKRTHDILERKTGGLVVWRSGSKIILYRGIDYKYPYFLSDKVLRDDNSDDALLHVDGDDKNCDERESHLSDMNSTTHDGQSSNFKTIKSALVQGVGAPNKVRFQLPGEAELLEEVDSLLEGLGPRFTDWWGFDPVPVDADLLPAVIPGFRHPFRLLPYGVKSNLTDDELTSLKRLGRPLPCHFALGRNRKLQGVAAAIIKLWERCEIVKIAVKRGVQNTSNKIMAEELKYLTGGTLLSRNKEVIVIYRGKDFLPAAASSAIQERRNVLINKVKAENNSSVTSSSHSEGRDMTLPKDKEIIEKRILAKANEAIKRTTIKLSQALERKEKAEKLLEKLERAVSPQEQEIDKEGITQEERYMLRRIGLKMQPFLLLGRRGVFDGTVENMHLHWKYRELVKILCKHGSLEYVHQTAQTLEAESGGILVAVERVSKGYAIIVYRGKNYSRPDTLRPRTLLNKKQALKRSIEAQRHQALKLHVLKLDKNINELKLQMAKDEASSKEIAEELRSDLEQHIELIDGGGARHNQHEASSISTNYNSPKEASVDNQQPTQEQHIRLIDRDGVTQDKLEATSNSTNCNSPKETSVDNQQPTQEQHIELIDSGGAHQDKHEASSNSINCNSPKEASVDNQQLTKEQHIELIDSDGVLQDKHEASSNSTNCNSPKEASVDNQQPTQEQHIRLIDSSGAHQGEPDFGGRLVHPERQVDETSDFVVDTGYGVSNNKAMEALISSSKSDPEPSAPVINKSSNEFPSRSSYLSNRERLLLRKQALRMKNRLDIAIGKSNIVTGLAKAIRDHFQRIPFVIVNVKGRAKGTSVHELVSKLEQATGGVLVSQEPSKIILYRGWGAGSNPGTNLNINDSKEEGAKPSVSPELLEAIRIECGLL